MIHLRNTLYMPYGAYELKARYQTNLMLAMLITITMIGLVLTAAWVSSLLSGEEMIVIAPRPVVDDGPITIGPPPTIVREEPQIRSDGPVAPPVDIRSGPIEIVPDDLAPDGGEILSTPAEIRDYLNSDPNGLSGGGSNVIFEAPRQEERPDPLDYQYVDREPEFIYEYVPPYPRLLRDAGITGTVVVRVLVDEHGNVIDAMVHKTSDTPGLDEVALDAAYKNKFSPAIRSGQPVKHWVSYSVVFKLE